MRRMDEPGIHRFRNNAKAIPWGNKGWQEAYEHGTIDLSVRTLPDLDRFERAHDGHRFVNLCSCSYLGLHDHPAVLDGAMRALAGEKTFLMPLSRIRMRFALLDELEAGLGELFRAPSLATLSASVAIAGTLPLVASGHLMDDGEPRVMVFDKNAHFAMNLIKPICADETTVLTAPHNDLDFVADACKRYPRVAYVADGAYSMGGATVIAGLLELQDRYGLFLFFDDSHSLSVWGASGEGFVRAHLGDELNPLTVIVASLGKGFGGSGGVVMLGPGRHRDILVRFGGPIAWSQSQNVPAIGACLGSLAVHRTPELARLQQLLLANLAVFDEQLPNPNRGNGLPIRLIPAGDEEQATTSSGRLLERGFYTSAVFFPILAKGKAGLRVMLRANNRPEDVLEFCNAVREVMRYESANAA
jgi:7-keto-8-aminopelargonate synthetase-like enzyme